MNPAVFRRRSRIERRWNGIC
jgi:hypothetical protein